MARLLYSGRDTVTVDAEAFGIRLIGWEEREIEKCIWQENKETAELFYQLATQWRIDGMSGQRLGLRYDVIPAVMDLMGTTQDRKTLFLGLRIMEAAVINLR